MNTQTIKRKPNTNIRQSTINKLCVTLADFSECFPNGTPDKKLRETFYSYCKRYKVNTNLWFSLKKLGYVAQDKSGWVLKMKRSEVNKNLANTIIENYNQYVKTIKSKTDNEQPLQIEEPIRNPMSVLEIAKQRKNDIEKAVNEAVKNDKNGTFVVYELDEFNAMISDGKEKFDTLEKAKCSLKKLGSFVIVKVVANCDVEPVVVMKKK